MLLRDAGQPPVAPVLEAEIAEALADLKPGCTLEHLQVRAVGGCWQMTESA